MKILVYILISAQCFVGYSQNVNCDNFKTSISTENIKINQVKKEIELLCKTDSSYYLDNDNSITKRKVVPNYYQFQIIEINDSNNSYELFYLNIFTYRKKVIYLNLQYIDSNKTVLHFTKEKYNKMIANHFGILKTPIDTTHKHFNPTKEIIISFDHGDDGDDESDELYNLYKNKNRKEILKWCYSLSAEIRFQGIWGLYWLKRDGMELNKVEEKMICIISKEKTPILYYGGCEIGNSSIKEYFDLVQDEK